MASGAPRGPALKNLSRPRVELTQFRVLRIDARKFARMWAALICFDRQAPSSNGTIIGRNVLPGTELAFATPIRCNRLGLLGWKPKVLNHTTAIFRQVNKHNPRTHHDALEFPDGKMVLLTELVEAQEATVLQLPAQPVTAAETKAQERVPHVG